MVMFCFGFLFYCSDCLSTCPGLLLWFLIELHLVLVLLMTFPVYLSTKFCLFIVQCF